MSTAGLVADIGRKSVRFALAGGDQGNVPRDVAHFSTADHPPFTNALIAYLDRVGMQGDHIPSMLSIAGMARGDVVNVTGSRWFVSLSGVEAVLRIRPRAFNECAANALALTTLAPTDFQPIFGALPALKPGGVFLVVGAGSGLGVSLLVTAGDRLVPLQTEAGHIAFAARTPEERKILAHLERRGAPVSWEALLSAQGLVNAYVALSDRPPIVPPPPEDITRNAARDPVATAAVATFLGAFGAYIGDLILAYGAWDGVFLTGAIARFFGPRFADPQFRRRLEDKDAFRRQLAQVALAVVRRNDLELVGAAIALGQR